MLLFFKMAGVLFEDIFDVKDIDPEGKKFDRGKMLLMKVNTTIAGWLMASSKCRDVLRRDFFLFP